MNFEKVQNYRGFRFTESSSIERFSCIKKPMSTYVLLTLSYRISKENTEICDIIYCDIQLAVKSKFLRLKNSLRNL